jgi:hypothetical protein
MPIRDDAITPLEQEQCMRELLSPITCGRWKKCEHVRFDSGLESW